jgi:hypothetical protein
VSHERAARLRNWVVLPISGLALSLHQSRVRVSKRAGPQRTIEGTDHVRLGQKLWAAGVLSPLAAAILFSGVTPMRAEEAAIDKGFSEALSKFDVAQHDLENGKSETTKAIWSHGNDITLSGGFGGGTEKGWEQIGPRLDWVAAHFSKGTSIFERIAARSSGELGYMVQIEHIGYQVRASQPPLRATIG